MLPEVASVFSVVWMGGFFHLVRHTSSQHLGCRLNDVLTWPQALCAERGPLRDLFGLKLPAARCVIAIVDFVFPVKLFYCFSKLTLGLRVSFSKHKSFQKFAYFFTFKEKKNFLDPKLM